VRVLRPSPRLAPYVDHYWFSARATAPAIQLLPDGRVDLVIARTSSQAACTVYGSVTAQTRLDLTPGACYVGVQFRPGQARHVLAASAWELTNAAVNGTDALQLALTMALDARTPLEMVAALDAALQRRLIEMQPAVTRVDRIVAQIEAARGQITIAQLADKFAVSRRQIERDVLAAVGLAPKAYASILRFRHAAELLQGGAPLPDAAVVAGYADQSHLSRAIRRYTGLTPRGYARGDVAFFQDNKTPLREHDGFPAMRSSPP
jgi:AraC-like DNA-binding protein